jgi:hypothetical protein
MAIIPAPDYAEQICQSLKNNQTPAAVALWPSATLMEFIVATNAWLRF